ncbi:Helix-turn-helix domain-containing protein [Parafrankia irregularis]|uniref:Helix-turn-helix domain-containing protein n=1 Tax=Parafrankia irregularis TaxID=795642 RepID=A0A0S4QEM6_9ACTN|nr:MULTISPECIES: helix-turn-helix transcriptional regulator [Parafrankia]MBE3206518.1 helix-turn-helix domain-containing protein [Parafrankia sp. CH37]CUU53988.1 Helix-turn-helix domain-containing protein [Parafrankia irregularis]
MTNTRGVPPYTARGKVEGEDWQAVADALNERMSQKRMGQQALATASGVSVATLRQLQRGAHGRRVQDVTLTAVARALDWPDDHLVHVLVRGEKPEEATSGRRTARGGSGAGTDRQILAVLLRIEHRLADLSERIAPTGPPQS